MKQRTLSEYLQLSRALTAEHEKSGVVPKRLAVLSSFSADFLRPYLIVESSELVPLQPWFAPFGQLEPILMDPASPLVAQAPDTIWIAMRLEDIDRALVHEAPSLDGDAIRLRLRALTDRAVALARSARAQHKASILVSNFAWPFGAGATPFDASDPDGPHFALAEANRELARALRTIGGAYVFDYAGVVADAGAESWRDAKLFHMARVPTSPANQARLARSVARTAAATLRSPAKCIVLDLDNTLWGGVLGDDGIGGVQLGDDYPGSVFKEFQAALLGYRRRGFLLAIASKNDEANVREMLETHPEQLLRSEHFAYIAASWDPKPAGLRRIAEALNIGIESLIFVDDNPAERAQVRAELPLVHVVELPAEPLRYLEALHGVALLDRTGLLEEDRERARMYADEEKRRRALAAAPSSGNYLADMRMEAIVGLADETTIGRIHQLIHKTNQFNLTTRRHELAYVQELATSGSARVAWLRLRDAFGDMGLVCAGILRQIDPRTWEVDTFLMSCRVMGRQVERAFLAYLAELARERGAERLIARYRPTAANAVVRELYPSHGFVELDRRADETSFELAIANAPAWPEFLARKSAGDNT